MKKKLLILAFFFVFFFPMKTFAITSIKTYTASYSTVNSCNNSSCTWQNPSLAAKRVRIYDTITHTANTTLSYTMNIDVITNYDDLTPVSCGMFWDAGDTFGGTNTFLRTYNGRYSSSKHMITINFGNVRSFASTNTTSIFVECEMNTASLIYGVSASSTTTSNTNNANNSEIIANNNQNTQIIINNDNRNTQQIINSQNQTTEAINDINDTLQDTNIDDEEVEGKFEDVDTISDTPITDLLTMPLVLLNKLYSGMSGSCSTYTIGTLFNTTISFPCFNGQQIFGSTVWSIIDGLFVLFMLYNMGMMIVSFFESVTSLHDTFDDMYEPQHVYKPKHGGGK